jgi:hypothetical protein
MNTNPTPEDNTEGIPDSVLSLQQTPTVETEAEDEVVAHFSGGSFLICVSQN